MNLFFISTPFQALNAFEAIRKYNCKDNIVVIRELESSDADQKLLNLLHRYDWLDIITLPRKSSGIKPRLIRLLGSLKRTNTNLTFDNVFYAEYPSRHIETVLANINILYNEVMFDDGTWTLRAYETHLKKQAKTEGSSLKRSLTLNLFGYKAPRPRSPGQNFNLFTIFDIQDKNITIIKNSLDVLKSEILATPSIIDEKIIAFIGDGGTDLGLNLDSYCRYIEQISTKGVKVVYFPHRNEKQHVKDRISLINNLQYATNSKGSIELELAKFKNIEAIYGFYSTALFSLSKLYPKISIFTRKLTHDDFDHPERLEYLVHIVDTYLSATNVKKWL
ncbi:alpha-2,8-polysialyltransferase family protein [Vibrio sp. IRLE0018]|uniref:alpha-2,8-polysialyltransferase family protein n=1 Tax=Vibrio floridensis TaxID=2908007 RepID=UPI001F3F8D40|nr:alpha-2,8-polysialyltransferase family protein [Vibrio floridensis]MCF8780179.1 alpha-2,8-polysialyltransferase family protein [Vibrio floridensis]